MIQAKETYKEELSKHVEGIFKKYVKPGLHICDIATVVTAGIAGGIFK